ncbi:hypothetical protein CU097_010849 [Rhizopus azygosporus]|uniref:tRNA (adenine(58)-N(1))-methyltransferase catalytic subunit TRM61 n=1 Tax=Rhizopus azygosporus TaxID=86630 RepID=A0A367KAL6_RHIAZ|nr:hypothetical protein CU097_010849 [Rhizopus azygosporus]CEG67030.1 hypothetical protein RMATCC62417_03514 [Rhizopus microsporus]
MFRTSQKKLSPVILKGLCRFSTFQEGDFCILRNVKNNKIFFTGPLCSNGQRGVADGSISHESIIGKKPRSRIVVDKGSTVYMAHFPTLQEYVLNVPRKCTPIYPKDASTIVHMLDVQPGDKVLEAGTGNGSLTLYLAKAVSHEGKVDTFDVRQEHSKTAQTHVQRYSRGKYASVVSFHVGSLGDKLQEMMEPKEEYDAIVLDMPQPSDEIPKILPYLKNDRFIVCYLPNMTQVLSLVEFIRDVPLVLEDCLEVAWKEWEVKATYIRSLLNDANEKQNDEPVKPHTWICRPKNWDVKGHTAFLVKLRKTAPVQDSTVS